MFVVNFRLQSRKFPIIEINASVSMILIINLLKDHRKIFFFKKLFRNPASWQFNGRLPNSIQDHCQNNYSYLLFLLCDNGTPSITEDYLPCARMVFTMSLGKKMGICAKGALKVNYRVD